MQTMKKEKKEAILENQYLDLELTDYHDESLFGRKTSALPLIIQPKACVYNSLVQLMKLKR